MPPPPPRGRLDVSNKACMLQHFLQPTRTNKSGIANNDQICAKTIKHTLTPGFFTKAKRAWAKRAPQLWQKKWEGMTYIKYTKTHTNISKIRWKVRNRYDLRAIPKQRGAAAEGRRPLCLSITLIHIDSLLFNVF